MAHSIRDKGIRLLIAAAAVALVIGVLQAGGSGGPPPDRGQPGLYAPHVEGEVLIKFRPTAGPNERASLRAQMQATKKTTFRSGAEHWQLAPGWQVDQAIAALRHNPHVQYVEPNYLVQLDVAPDDARYGELWGMNNTGQTGGTPGADIDAERAWNVSTGSHNVLVAVIDTGVDYNHPDLAANIWTNPGEIPANGVDDDGNGFIDDIHGWDFYNNDSDPFDDNGHGTHVSGTIGGVGNNGIGVAGVSWNVSIMGVKFLSGGGSGSTTGAISSVDYATMMGVDIMSNSWGGGGFSQALGDAINGAAAQEIVFVAAAGNSGSNNDVTPHYPSSYDYPNVIAVAATDHNDNKASFSSFGLTSVDLGAPGVNTLSTLPGNSYGEYSGTSMATPHVSGAAALVRAVAPGTSAALVRQILMSFADPIPSMAGITVSGGRLNAFFPIAEPDDTPPGMIDDLATAGATSNSLFVEWTATGDDGATGTAATYDLRYSTSPIDDMNFDMAAKAAGLPAPGPSGSPESAEVTGLIADTLYYFAIKAKDEWGNAGPLSNIASGSTLPPPTFASSPASFSAALLTGQMATRTLTLQNAGVGTLDWSIPLPSVSGPVVTQYEPLDLGKGEPDPRPGIPAVNGFGGPDVYGYRWMDSDEAGGPVFSWTDIGMTGTPVAGLDGDDENAGPIPIGFDFSFYGNTFDSVRVSTNGWVSFTSTSTSYSNQPLPSGSGPENMIAAFWDDLHFRGATRVTYQNVGGNFVIQFTEVDTYGTGSVLTFQVELQPSGAIHLRYLSMVGNTTSATIGIQNADRNDGLTVVYNNAYVHDNLEIRIAAVPQWLTASPTSGRLYAGESADVEVVIDATGLDGGTYEGSVNVGTNDPMQPVVGHPVTLNVTGAPAIGVSPASFDFGLVYFGFDATETLTINNTGTDALTVSSIVSGDPQVTVSPTSLSIPAHSSGAVDVTYTPSAPGNLATTLTVNSDASNAAQVFVDVVGYSLPAPAILVNPASFSETLYTGGTVARNLRVRNTGGSDLDVALSVELGSAAAVPTPVPDLPKGDDSADGTGDYIIQREGGPDAFGYRYRDSDAPGGPVFDWVDISAIGTRIPFSAEADDSNVGPLPIGFDFEFYGNTFSTVRASTNGFLSFTSTLSDLSNSTLPGTGAPENLLAAFHDDLRFYGAANGAAAYYHNDGSRFIVQYKNVSKYGQSSSSIMNFEWILYPSGKIVYQYLNMSGTLTSATVGIQDSTRTIGLETSYNESYVHNNMAIEYSRVPDWLAVSPSSAVIPPGGFRDFTVTFNAGDSGDRVFNGTVHIDTNIPDPPFVDVPATLTVLGVADVAMDPESMDYGARFIGYPHLQILHVQNVGTGALLVTGVQSDDPTLFVEEPISGGAEFTIPPGGEVEYILRWLPPGPMVLDALVTVYSDDPDEPALAMPVTGTAIPAPIVGWSPGSFSESLFVGEASTQSLLLTNTGGSDLQFNIGVNLTGAVVVQDRSPDLPKGVEPTEHGAPVALGAGGPDMFGYRWKDSDEPGGPVFDWVDISTVGTQIPFSAEADDVNYGPIDIGFDFEFYGSTFSTVRASTNGFLSFTSTSSDLSNSALPGTGSPENLLAAFHDDLRFYGSANGAAAYYHNDGTRFIVQYKNVSKYGQSSSSIMNFEWILYPSGKIVYQYLNMSGTLDSATVGIQNATRDDGLQIAYNQDYMHDGLAIEIQAVPDWLRVGTASGTIPPGGSMTIPVQLSAVGLLGGMYNGSLRILTNDPANALVTLPATLAVTGFPAIDIQPSPLDFGTVFVGTSSTLPMVVSNPGSDVLNVTNVAISGDFTVDTTPYSIPPGGELVLDVTFTPTTAGALTGSLDCTSNATGVPVYSVPLMGDGLLPPVAEPDPDTVAEVAEVALPPAGMTTETLRLWNTGDSDLYWSASVNTSGEESTAAPPVQYTTAVELPKGDDSADGTGFAIAGSGGPDAFGYRWKDSDEPGGPVFDWVDITTVGTPVPFASYVDDGNVGPIPIGFNFPFYGNTFSELYAVSNGWMSFTNSTLSTYTNQALPNSASSVPENLLAAFWDDMVYDESDGNYAYYYNDGSRFIITYYIRRIAAFTPPFYEFQVILYPNGKIVFQYNGLGSNLTSHTIGIQNATKDDGLTVVHNATYLHEQLAIEFAAAPDWLTIDPVTGVIPAGGYQDIMVHLNSAGLEAGDYTGSIHFSTNDPFNGTFDVPVTLHVSEVDLDYLNVDPNTINLGSHGNTIRAAIQLPAGYDPYAIDIDSVSIYGQLFANPNPIAYTDENGDGVMELVVKFDRAGFEALVPEGSSVPVTVTGEVHDVTWFTGTDYVRVIRPQMTAPSGGEYVYGGQVLTVSWLTPVLNEGGGGGIIMEGVSYDIFLSRDGGVSWEQLGTVSEQNSFSWIVNGTATTQAMVRVVASDNQGVMGYDTSNGVFTIASGLLPPNSVPELFLNSDETDVIFVWKRPETDLQHGPPDSYIVYVATSAQGPFLPILSVAEETARYPHGSLPQDKVLYFKVIAENGAGASGD